MFQQNNPLVLWLWRTFTASSVATACCFTVQGQCKTDQTNINDSVTVAWTDKLIDALGEDNACQVQRADDDQDRFTANTPCNIFAGRVMERMYAIKDFYVSPPQENKPYYLASEIGTLLQTGVWDGWTDLGTADSQDVLNSAKTAADAGKAVIAVWVNPDANSPGHVALIGPGPLMHSATWNEDTPPAASLSLGNVGSGFLGKPLSCAFSSKKAPDVHIWTH